MQRSCGPLPHHRLALAQVVRRDATRTLAMAMCAWGIARQLQDSAEAALVGLAMSLLAAIVNVMTTLIVIALMVITISCIAAALL